MIENGPIFFCRENAIFSVMPVKVFCPGDYGHTDRTRVFVSCSHIIAHEIIENDFLNFFDNFFVAELLFPFF